MALTKTEWAQNLRKGDLVCCTYKTTTNYYAKVQYVLTQSQTESGFAVQLEEVDGLLDIFWIFPR